MRVLLPLILFLIVSESAWAQNRSLDYYLSRAIENSPAITEQQDRADSARLQKDIINADLNLPSAMATGDYVYAPFSSHWGYDEAITDGGLYSALLNIDYPIFNNKSKDFRLQASDVSIQQTEYQIERIQHELRRSVTDQYITTYQDELYLHYLEDIQDLLNQQRQVMESLAEQGVSQVTDVKQLDIELQNNRIARKKAEKAYQQDLLQLNAQCGLADSTTSIQLMDPSIIVDTLISGQSHFMNRFKLDSLQIAAQQQVSELKYQPDVSLFGNTGLNAVKFTGIQNHFGFSVGLHISVPIFDGNQKQITRNQTLLQQHSVDAYQQRFKTQRNVQLASLQKQLDQTEDQLNLIRRQLSQYEDLLSDYQQELSQGILSVVDYLTVLRNYAAAQQQQVQTLGEEWRLKNEFNYWNW